MVKKIKAELEATGLEWSLENGTRHIKIMLVDRLVGIMPLKGGGGSPGRAHANILAQIRRAAKELAACPAT